MRLKFNLAIPTEAAKAEDYLHQIRAKKGVTEIKRVLPKRTLNQNSYLHLIISAFGNHFGYSLEEAKAIYKEINSGVYKYKKRGRTFWRSSADISKEEMAVTIDKFMQKSAEYGYPLPPATDIGWLREIENEIERSKYYFR